MESVENKTCVITGANSGIGKAAALGLAKLGAGIIMIVRNRFRGEAAMKEIISATGNKKVELQLCYLSSFESIRECAENIHLHHKKIDILINNAGAYFSKRHLTKNGVEATFQVNYLSRFILTNLLLELLSKADGGKIINVNGEYHRGGKLNFDDISFSKKYRGICAASQAKLADMIFVHRMAKKINELGITINALHPGIVATNAVENDPDASLIKKVLYRAVKPFLASPEKGAGTILYLAADNEVRNTTGKYFINKRIVQPSSASRNEETADKLWALSEKLTGLNTNAIINKILKEKIQQPLNG